MLYTSNTTHVLRFFLSRLCGVLYVFNNQRKENGNEKMNFDNDEDALEFINRLLERLHQADYINQGSKIEVVYVASGGQHVETQINIGSHPNEGSEKETKDNIPPPEAMARAVERTMAQGYWWASTAWAVVYRVYQMKGYTGGISQFVREVEEWPWQRKPEYECTYDAVCKPIRSGKLTGMPDGWVMNGASSQYANLGQELLNEFQKLELQFQK